eukprot:1976931-Pyramimonas_sp.AAC.1
MSRAGRPPHISPPVRPGRFQSPRGGFRRLGFPPPRGGRNAQVPRQFLGHEAFLEGAEPLEAQQKQAEYFRSSASGA